MALRVMGCGGVGDRPPDLVVVIIAVRAWMVGYWGDRAQPLILLLYVMPLAPEQEQLRILLISSPGWVRETIHDLHGRGFASAGDWSSLQPGANPGEVVSILTRWRSRP